MEHFLFRLRVQLEVEGQMEIRYKKLKVHSGDVSINDSGVTQWGVCQCSWLRGYGEWLLVGE